MPKALGQSVYLSTFAAQCPALCGMVASGDMVFLSLHMGEEFGPDYQDQARKVCWYLAEQGCRIVADVSVKTMEQFSCRDLAALARELKIWALRVDYGLDKEQILALAQKMPVVVNASTISWEDTREIGSQGRQVYAMHNFYPRPETGLDEEYLLETTRALHQAGLGVMAFIPGDTLLRGPVYEGLPTLEAHRRAAPSAAFVDLAMGYGIDQIFLGDPGISQGEWQRIQRFCRQQVISVPAVLEAPYRHLYDRVFTCRVDSPKALVRFQESREYASRGREVAPENCLPRPRGTITLDNRNYGRYTGEIQLIRRDLSQDPRVNVIGQVPPAYFPLLEHIGGGSRFVLVEPE